MTSHSRALRFLGHPTQRMKESAFWSIQMMLVAVTVAHVAVEFLDVFEKIAGTDSLIHLPAMLYLIPITFAGLRYGTEGGLLTAAAAGVLSIPNIVIWHGRGFEWLGESMFLLLVMGLGLVTAGVVDREHRQRSQAEDNSRRLRLANVVSRMLSRTPGLERALDVALSVMKEMLGLKSAEVIPPDAPSTPSPGLDMPIATETAELGTLRVERDSPMTEDELELLAVLAAQMAVAIENDRLRQSEHERLKTYARLVTEAQEEERKRIARDLHDDVAQPMIVLLRKLEEIVEDVPDSMVPRLCAAMTHVQSLLGDVRRFDRDLRPRLLDDLGLVAAIKWLTAVLADRSGIKGEITVRGAVENLPPHTSLTLFRVAQEALKNVEKHSRSQRVNIEIRRDDDRVWMAVADTGQGFVVSEATSEQTDGWGLLGMEERMKLAGGRLTIRSEPGQGTEVIAEAPTSIENDSMDSTRRRSRAVTGVH
jgi:signal transduction histidine kinase